jgi:hypothetical protein
MPTIQFNIEQDELTKLLDLTGEKTGTKALQFTIDGYQKLVEQYAILESMGLNVLERVCLSMKKRSLFNTP